MKEIAIFTESEKIKARPLLKAKENGDHESAVNFTRMQLKGYKRALAEYKKHPVDEIVTPEYVDKDDLFYDLMCYTVSEKIEELEERIEDDENWMMKAEVNTNE